MAEAQLDKINGSLRFTKCWKILNSCRNNTAFKHVKFPTMFPSFPFSSSFFSFAFLFIYFLAGFVFVFILFCFSFFVAMGNLNSLLTQSYSSSLFNPLPTLTLWLQHVDCL